MNDENISNIENDDDIVLQIIKCMELIRNKHGRDIPQNIINDNIRCPICGVGILSYRISNYNGHTHGTCSTNGCVHWIE